MPRGRRRSRAVHCRARDLFSARRHVRALWAFALGALFPRGSRLDAVENRWRRLVDLPRERRCSFRCPTDSISTAGAAVYRLSPITALAVAAR